MKRLTDVRTIERLAQAQRGVFSTADLRTALAERHPAAFVRRVRGLTEVGVLRRFVRGWYVSEEFDLFTLSQRLSPAATVSFGAVLSRDLLIGTRPERRVTSTKPGPRRTYQGLGVEVVHLSIAAHLDFGWTLVDGVRWADPEKAVLDALYFHLRGRRYVFDIYSDIDYRRLDARRLRDYLSRYRNPRFVAFARRLLEMV